MLLKGICGITTLMKPLILVSGVLLVAEAAWIGFASRSLAFSPPTPLAAEMYFDFMALLFLATSASLLTNHVAVSIRKRRLLVSLRRKYGSPRNARTGPVVMLVLSSAFFLALLHVAYKLNYLWVLVVQAFLFLFLLANTCETAPDSLKDLYYRVSKLRRDWRGAQALLFYRGKLTAATFAALLILAGCLLFAHYEKKVYGIFDPEPIIGFVAIVGTFACMVYVGLLSSYWYFKRKGRYRFPLDADA